MTEIKSRVHEEDGDGQLVEANWRLEGSQLMALRRVVMLEDLYGDKIGKGCVDEAEILRHSDQRT